MKTIEEIKEIGHGMCQITFEDGTKQFKKGRLKDFQKLLKSKNKLTSW